MFSLLHTSNAAASIFPVEAACCLRPAPVGCKASSWIGGFGLPSQKGTYQGQSLDRRNTRRVSVE
jgi:hypothetical protein